jgi:hypothetical protein
VNGNRKNKYLNIFGSEGGGREVGEGKADERSSIIEKTSILCLSFQT